MNEDLLNIWFENSAKKFPNQNVVFIRVRKGDMQKIKDELKKIYSVHIVGIEEFEEEKMPSIGMNPIIVSEDYYGAVENLKFIINRGIIYIEDVNSINRFIYIIKNRSLNHNNEIKYELVQKVEFESLLKNETIDLEKFVRERLYLLEKINSNFESITHDSLMIYLNNYFKNKILFASFAQLLYRLANLDFTSTTKRVGGNIRQILGVKSSSISSNRLVNIKRNQLNKNFRVYDLKENTFVSDTKIKIAQELVKLNIKELDVTKISKITELPLKKIETMYREAFLG